MDFEGDSTDSDKSSSWPMALGWALVHSRKCCAMFVPWDGVPRGSRMGTTFLDWTFLAFLDWRLLVNKCALLDWRLVRFGNFWSCVTDKGHLGLPAQGGGSIAGISRGAGLVFACVVLMFRHILAKALAPEVTTMTPNRHQIAPRLLPASAQNQVV